MGVRPVELTVVGRPLHIVVGLLQQIIGMQTSTNTGTDSNTDNTAGTTPTFNAYRADFSGIPSSLSRSTSDCSSRGVGVDDMVLGGVGAVQSTRPRGSR
jgi:hypothetical protein